MSRESVNRSKWWTCWKRCDPSKGRISERSLDLRIRLWLIFLRNSAWVQTVQCFCGAKQNERNARKRFEKWPRLRHSRDNEKWNQLKSRFKSVWQAKEVNFDFDSFSGPECSVNDSVIWFKPLSDVHATLESEQRQFMDVDSSRSQNKFCKSWFLEVPKQVLQKLIPRGPKTSFSKVDSSRYKKQVLQNRWVWW